MELESAQEEAGDLHNDADGLGTSLRVRDAVRSVQPTGILAVQAEEPPSAVIRRSEWPVQLTYGDFDGPPISNTRPTLILYMVLEDRPEIIEAPYGSPSATPVSV